MSMPAYGARCCFNAGRRRLNARPRRRILSAANAQWVPPLPNGLTRQARFWIDDIWMIGDACRFRPIAHKDPLYLGLRGMPRYDLCRKIAAAERAVHLGQSPALLGPRASLGCIRLGHIVGNCRGTTCAAPL